MSARHPFGWSYPPGCSGPPDDYEQPLFRCRQCGAFVGHPRKEVHEHRVTCFGIADPDFGCECGNNVRHEPHSWVMDVTETLVFQCKRCQSTSEYSA